MVVCLLFSSTKGHEGARRWAFFWKVSRFVPFCTVFSFTPGTGAGGTGGVVLWPGQTRRSAPTIAAVGPGRAQGRPYEGCRKQGRHVGLPLRWGVITSFSFFQGCILMVEMGYAGWQGGGVREFGDWRDGDWRAWAHGRAPLQFDGNRAAEVLTRAEIGVRYTRILGGRRLGMASVMG